MTVPLGRDDMGTADTMGAGHKAGSFHIFGGWETEKPGSRSELWTSTHTLQ